MSWVIGLECPTCSEDCAHVTGSKPGPLGRRVTAIAECPNGHQWQIIAELLSVGGGRQVATPL